MQWGLSDSACILPSRRRRIGPRRRHDDAGGPLLHLLGDRVSKITILTATKH